MLVRHHTRMAVLCLATSIFVQSAYSQTDSGNTTAEPSSTTPNAYIPGNLTVAPFTPPPPKAPVAPLTDAAATIVVKDKENHTVILQRGQASMAPDIPSGDETSTGTPTPDLSQFPVRPAITTLQIGGMVYDQNISLIHWRHPDTHQEYTAALGYDVNLLGQVGKFVRQGKAYQLFLVCTPQSTSGQLAELRAQRGLPPIVAPEVTADEYHLISGDSSDAVGMEPLLAIHEVYLAEKNRLIQYQHDIKEYRAQEKAWKDAHPEPTSPTVFWFKPHRNSRYLSEQDKLDQAAAASARAESMDASQTGQEGGNP